MFRAAGSGYLQLEGTQQRDDIGVPRSRALGVDMLASSNLGRERSRLGVRMQLFQGIVAMLVAELRKTTLDI